ncbi:MAG TPA: hypothetical protein VLF60_02725 [Candidatus Saccharimonadales bacterium]|nr:hypothetical protein [Candidatus Saccharimonadales bacterium]
MHFMRRVAVTLLYSVFSATLFSFGLLLSLQVVLTTPHTIEGALDKSGIYDSLVHDVLAQQSNQTNNIPIEQPQIQSAIQQAFPASLLRSDANQIIEGTFDWLKGKTPSPQFSIDINGARENLATNIANYVQQRLTSLPTCTTVPTDLNAFTMTCVPTGFDIPTAVAQAKHDILNVNGSLSQPTLTADTLKNNQGQTIPQQFHGVPAAYHSAVLAIYATGIAALLAAAGIILLDQTKKIALRRVGIGAVTVGISSGLLAWFGDFALRKAIAKLTAATQQNELLQAKVTSVIQLLTHQVRTVWLEYAIAVVVLGVGVLVLAKLLPHKVVPPVASELPPVPDRPPQK